MRGLTGITAALAAPRVIAGSPWRELRHSTPPQGVALDWLGYPSLPKLDYQSRNALVDGIYRGEDGISSSLAKGTVEYGRGGWMSYICWANGRGAPWYCSLRRRYCGRQGAARAYIVGNISAMRGGGYQADAEDAAMNYRGFTFPLMGISRQY